VYDYFSGEEDLAQRVLRFVGDPTRRIQEDYLRILRLFRFQAHYCDDFSLPMQIEACAANLDGLDDLSGERVQMEMLKILAAPKPLYVLMVMNKVGVFNHLVPGASEELNLNGLKELMRLEGLDEDVAKVNPYIRLAAILMPANPSPEVVIALAERWKLSSDDRNFLRVILDQEHHIRSDMNDAQAKKEIRTLTKEYFISTAIVRWTAECDYVPDRKTEIDESYGKLIAFAKEWKVPIMPIRGRDLLELGVGEGKEVGALLKRAEDLWESQDYKTTRDELFTFVKEQIEPVNF
jgi:poly(A) polymerase